MAAKPGQPEPARADPEHPELSGSMDGIAAELHAQADRSRRVLLLIVLTQGAVLTLAILAIIVLAVGFFRQGHRITSDEHLTRLAECDTHYSIGTAEPSPQTTRVGVDIIEAERKAFIVLGCPGQLGPPSHELMVLAKKFGIPVRY